MGFFWDAEVAMMYGIEIEVQQTTPYMIWRRLVLHNELLQAGLTAGHISGFIGVTTPIEEEEQEMEEMEMEEWYDHEFRLGNFLDDRGNGCRLTSEFSKAASIALGREDHRIRLVPYCAGNEISEFRALVVHGPSRTFANPTEREAAAGARGCVNLPWGSFAKPAPPVPEGVQEDIETVVATLGMQKVYDGVSATWNLVSGASGG